MSLPRFLASALSLLPLVAPAAEPAALPTPPPMREVEPGIYELGGVRLDQKARTVTFAATMNMTEGALEYALVGSNGKTHESILSTKVQPYHIHLAMLLLGSKTAATKKPDGKAEEKPPGVIDAEYLARAPKLTGDDIHIEVAWEHEGKKVLRPLEALIWDFRGERAMSRGRWLYNGSLFYEGKFCAQEDESIAAVIDDPCALINNPREGAESEASWVVRPEDVPPQGTPVTVTLKLPPAPEISPTKP